MKSLAFPRQPTRLLIMLVGSTALILAICVGMIVWVLDVSAASLDQSRKESEQLVLRSAIKIELRALGKQTADYTAWTELYDDLHGKGDRTWEEANLGTYLVPSFEVDAIAIISRTGDIRYAYYESSTRYHFASTASQTRLRALAHLAFAREVTARETSTSGLISFSGMPFAVALSTVRDTSLKRKSEFALVNMRSLNPTYLKKLGQDFGLQGLVLASSKGTGISLPQLTGGTSNIALSWRPVKPGRDLFSRVIPFTIAVTAACAVALVGLVGLWTMLWRLLREREARLLRAELNASNARAEAAEEMSRSKSAFIANMSHELRTPLNAIIGFSEVIAAQPLGPIGVPKYREYVLDIQESGRHLLGIVEAMLHISRIDAGKYEPAMEDVSVHESVDEAVTMLKVIAAQRAIALDIHLPSHPVSILADRQGLRQILINLLSNAVKFSPSRSVVTLTCLETEVCEICISDQGCGIPADLIPSLGQPFVQAEDVYRRSYQGTGLGLSICFRLARAMGASIAIESEEGVGTSVTLRLAIHPRSQLAMAS